MRDVLVPVCATMLELRLAGSCGSFGACKTHFQKSGLNAIEAMATRYVVSAVA